MNPTKSQPTSSLLVGLAMLRQDWDREGRTFLDNFQPFVGDCLRDAEPSGVTDGDLRDRVRERFGIDIPLRVLGTILRQMGRNGLVHRQDGIVRPTGTLLDREPLGAARSDGERRVSALVQKLREFAASEHRLEWTPEEAERALQLYVEDWHRSLSVMVAEYRAESPEPELVNDTVTGYTVADFVLKLRDYYPEPFGWLLDVIKGSMITAGFYLDVGHIEQRFADGCVAYLDTPNLLDLLVGEDDERAANEELLELCSEMRLQPACFDHTVSEVRGVLESNAATMRNARHSGADVRPTSHGLHERFSAAELEQVADRLPDLLAEQGIEVKRRPVWQGTSTTDELQLDEMLQRVVRYTRDGTRRRDLDSIVAIHQIRRGEEPVRFEAARAFFITSNRHVARAAAQHFGGCGQANAVPVVMTDHELATLLWLKTPTSRPDLPWKQVIADCRAAVRPSEALWSHYLDEVDRLREDGRIDADSYFVARYSTEARRALMDRTHGDDDQVTDTTVMELLEQAKSTVAAPAVTAAEDRRRQAEKRADTVLADVEGQVEAASSQGFENGRARGRAEGQEEQTAIVAARLASIAGWSAGVAVVLLTLLLSVFNLLDLAGSVRWILGLPFVAVTAFLAWATAMGDSVKGLVASWFEPWVRMWLTQEEPAE